MEIDIGSVVEDIRKILLDCDKSGKDAMKTKIKKHKKKQRYKEKKQKKGKTRKPHEACGYSYNGCTDARRPAYECPFFVHSETLNFELMWRRKYKKKRGKTQK